MNEKTLNLLNNCSVLLVEDDLIASTFIKNGLRAYCKQFFQATNGYEGIKIFCENKIDIIITDIHLPNLNGFEMIYEIKKIKPNQKFIVITSYDTDSNLLKSLKSGAFMFLRKPLKLEDIQTSLLMLNNNNDELIIHLNKHIKINLDKEILYFNDEIIFLTKTLDSLFWLLCYNLNNIVSYQSIENFVYNKDINKSSIQNAVSKLKKQLNIDIQNISEKGYILKSQI